MSKLVGDANIQPFTQTTTTVITSFKVSCRNVNLYNNASFIVDTFDANNNMVQRQVLTMTTPQYLEWGNNDNYVNTFVAKTLGFVIDSPVTPITPVTVVAPVQEQVQEQVQELDSFPYPEHVI